MDKKIIVFLNNHFNTNINYLDEKNYNITYIFTDTIIDNDETYILSLITYYDLIIIGGGPQHLTNHEIKHYPEVPILIKIIELSYKINKLLIGICLGCQLIALTFNIEIVKLKESHIGTSFLDLSTLNKDIIKSDKYLSNINFELIEHSFSFHNDGINPSGINHPEIDILCYSKTNVPYIIKHKNKSIYGFQFHPELTNISIHNSLNKYNINYDMNKLDDQIFKFINQTFFDSFIKIEN
jgi:GMP synthase-like glutamine amidotransferase